MRISYYFTRTLIHLLTSYITQLVKEKRRLKNQVYKGY